MSYLIALRKENQEKRVAGVTWQELPCAPLYLNRPTVAPGETPAPVAGSMLARRAVAVFRNTAAERCRLLLTNANS